MTETASHPQPRARIHIFTVEPRGHFPPHSQPVPFMPTERRGDPSGCSFLGCLPLACRAVLSWLPVLAPSAAVAPRPPDAFPRSAPAKPGPAEWATSTALGVPQPQCGHGTPGLGDNKVLVWLCRVAPLAPTPVEQLSFFPESFQQQCTKPGLVKAFLLCMNGFPLSELSWVADVEKSLCLCSAHDGAPGIETPWGSPGNAPCERGRDESRLSVPIFPHPRVISSYPRAIPAQSSVSGAEESPRGAHHGSVRVSRALGQLSAAFLGY